MTEQPTIESILVFSSYTVELNFDVIGQMVGQEPQSIRSLNHQTAAGTTWQLDLADFSLELPRSRGRLRT